MFESSRKHPATSIMGAAGFTLVELMIALFISGLVMAAVASVYTAQTRSYSQHDDVAGIQQNLRGALAILPMEIRLAGCDPEETKTPGILEATRTNFRFTMDIRGDAANLNSGDGDVDDPGENIAFGFRNTIDTNNNGIVDNGGADWSGTAPLGRHTGSGALNLQPLAENIEALEFNYILANGTPSLTPINLNEIRSIQVSILSRASNPAQNFLHSGSYTTASGDVWTPPQDNFRRRLVVTTIQCRNMGL